MFQTFSKLYQAKLSSPIGLYRLASSVLGTGTNLMALLRFAAHTHTSEIALIDDDQEISYQDLYKETQQLAIHLQEKYRIQSGKKAAILCRNHIPLVKSLFALSQLGADIYSLNVEMSVQQLNALILQYDFDVLIYDIDLWEMVRASNFEGTTLFSHHLTFDAIHELSQIVPPKNSRLKKGKTGKLVILTGGTTGTFKAAVRKPSISNFLNPFFALLNQLNLADYRSTYIAPPIYHGFGMAALLISIALGAKIIVTKRFNTSNATTLMIKHKIEVLVIVPLMLSRLVTLGKLGFVYTKVVISGGAPLSPPLIEKTFDTIQEDLANLYGTSEAGFCIMATTADLKQYPNTIGRKIKGVQIKLLNEQQQEVSIGDVGHLCIQSRWTMRNTTNAWIKTGDLAYVNEEGYYFLCGRVDDMIVSGGENVYPIELEQVLLQHNAIQQVAVIGISDKEFGQRLKAFVQLKPNQQLTAPTLKIWLKDRVARYHTPKEIVFLNEIPTTSIGKVNKKKLY